MVFYGENLPPKFFKSIDIIKDSDLCFIMGTSLKVGPFNQLPYYVKEDCMRVLINMEKVGNFKFDDLNSRDVFVESYTDDAIIKIVKSLGWEVIILVIF